MDLIDLEAHFFTRDYVEYLRQRRDSPRMERVKNGGVWEERLWLTQDMYALRTETLNPLLDFEGERLGVPIYLHPRLPSPRMIGPYADRYGLAGAALGFAAETQLHSCRLIHSGFFDRYPGITIILGHMGEGLPYWMFRMDSPWLKPAGGKTALSRRPSEYVLSNFLMTTSGMFHMPGFMCAYLALGAEKIVFATDYPFEKSIQAKGFMDWLPICDRDREKICSGNAAKLLKLYDLHRIVG
ncbi:MAG: amidohydrolase family protein [Deltaproteobacteria bacterium]|nr:amidohydrolase family protein [Deltaproteobacteria bacterium]MBW2138914.1 amidohydrolase family protein [Deltaproteobacteria bacterium]